MMAVAIKPAFGLQGKSKDRLVSLYSGGEIYAFLNEKHYPGGSAERDRLVDSLKDLQVLDQSLDTQEVVSGRNLTKKLNDLSEDEFQKILHIFGEYCG